MEEEPFACSSVSFSRIVAPCPGAGAPPCHTLPAGGTPAPRVTATKHAPWACTGEPDSKWAKRCNLRTWQYDLVLDWSSLSRGQMHYHLAHSRQAAASDVKAF